MSHFSIYQDNCADYTVLSNRFIDQYMIAANDAQLKIYLYLVRTMGARMSTSISDIADLFNYTEKDVLRALRYWEKQGLMALDYDDAKNITGLRLLDCSSAVPRTAFAPTQIAPVPSVNVPSVAPLASVVPISSKMNDNNDAESKKNYEKPNYTLDQLKAFKTNESTSRLLFVTEQYLKKTLSANEVRTILFISDQLGFSEDLIDYLIQYCVDRDKKDLRYIEKVAISWADQGITTPKQAAQLAGKYDKIVYDVMKALGKSGTPTQTEAAFVTRWTKEYGFTDDIIFEACERTVLATDKHRFEYADGILISWLKSGVHHKSDIQPLDENYRKNKASKPASNNKFNHFKQNDYDFDSLEKELISN